MAKSNLILLLVLSTLAYLAVCGDKPDQIIELFRHGARGPLSAYDQSWSLDEWGVLTPVGMRQQYILGKVLAQKYPQQFSDPYNYSQIYMISDTTPRCIQSAVTQLYGMYLGTGPSLNSNYPRELAVPPYEDARVKSIADSLANVEAIPYNHIPEIVNIVDTSNAVIFQGDTGLYCPNYVTWETENENDAAAQNAFKVFGPTFDNLNKLLPDSQKITTTSDVTSYGDTMLVDVFDNRTLPGGVTDPALAANLTHAFSWFSFHSWYGQLAQRQLGSYNLIQAFLDQIQAFRLGKDYYKAVLYSGHDDNIYAVLGAFGVVTEECLLENFNSYLENGTRVHPACYFPFFASNIIIEFYNSTDAPYVKMLYNNIALPICNGNYACPLDDFIFVAKNATGNNTHASYNKNCGVKTAAKTVGAGVAIESGASKGIQITLQTIALVAMTVLCIVLSVKVTKDNKKYKNLMNKVECEKMLYERLTEVRI